MCSRRSRRYKNKRLKEDRARSKKRKTKENENENEKEITEDTFNITTRTPCIPLLSQKQFITASRMPKSFTRTHAREGKAFQTPPVRRV